MFYFFLLLTGVLASVSCDSCTSPAGRDCSWYLNCLERKIPCGSQGYARKYADHFCRQYENNAPNFSSAGKRWISAVKRCLQRKLAPLLNRSPSCSYIKRYAFATHVDCYAKPDGSFGPSFCDLSIPDYWAVFRTINGAFLSEFKATVSGGWDTLLACWNNKRKRRSVDQQ